ncbi:GGDEF domain-containing protein [Vibrio sp. SCSIO 43136]|nr:GGDEF domain-containing protein [Vibrio sp. SCSIO 43136]
MQATKTSESEKVIRRLYQITNNYNKGFDAQIAELLKMGLERFNLDIAILSRISDDRYTVRNCVAPPGVALSVGDSFEFVHTYCHVTCYMNEPLAVEHVKHNELYKGHPAYEAFKLESYVGIPIYCEGELYGTLNFSSAKPYHRRFNQIDLDVLQLMASWLEVELIRRAQEEQLKVLNEKLEVLALYDSLTQLPNRRALFDSVPKSIESMSYEGGVGSVAMVDIDFFKAVNDDYGHQFGDEVLKQTADKVLNALRENDYVARFGGEEFLLWLPNADEVTTKALCERVMTSVSEIKVDGEPLTVSVGVCHFNVDEEEITNGSKVFDVLISLADKALYQSKDNGRNRATYTTHKVIDILDNSNHLEKIRE